MTDRSVRHALRCFFSLAPLVPVLFAFGCSDDGGDEQRDEDVRLGETTADASRPAGDSSTRLSQTADASTPTPAPPPTLPGLSRLEGLYWFKETVTTISYGVGGTASRLPTLAYYFRMFQPNGYVWVGAPRAEDKDMLCTGPRQTASGRKECAEYKLENGSLTIQVGTAKAWPVTKNQEGWTIGSYLYRPVPSFAGARLDGSYEHASCSGASCRQGMVTLDSSGRYSLSGSAATLVSVGDTSLTGGMASSAQGRYQIGAHSIQLQPSSGVPTTHFFLLDRSSSNEELIVIGETWYLKR
jgi:hypothetical protein